VTHLVICPFPLVLVVMNVLETGEHDFRRPRSPLVCTIEYPGISLVGIGHAVIGSLAIAAADAPRSTALDSPPTAPDGYAWKVIPELSDEFTGTNLDERKWLPKHPDWKGREPSVFDPSNVSVKDGMLQLRNTTRLKTLDGLKNPEKGCVGSVGVRFLKSPHRILRLLRGTNESFPGFA